MQKNAILLAANYSNRTGYAWSNIYRLYNSIAKASDLHDMAICISFAEISGEVEIIDSGIEFKTFIFNPYRIRGRSLYALRKNIIRNKIKYIYFTDMPVWHWLYVILRAWGVKKIIIHNRISVKNPKRSLPEKGIKKFLKTSINRLPLITADYVYAISEFVRFRLVNKNCFPEERVIKILNGIDVERYLCDEEVVSGGCVKIFCCSRATKHKGIGTLIRAAHILKSDIKNNNFHIRYAGSGPDLSYFKQLVNVLNIEADFEFLGMLSSTHDVACDSDIIVVPSEWGEGFGSTVVEGMAAGKPVIATEVGGIPEVLGNEQCGILVPPGDSKELANALLRLIRDEALRKRMGANGRERAIMRFDEKAYHENVTRRLLKDIDVEV